MITVENLVELTIEVESQDPIDWGMLNIDEKSALRLIAMNVLEMFPPTSDDDDRHIIMMVTMTKLILENFCLNLQLYGKK